MQAKMTWSEIQTAYPDEWVLVTDFEIVGRDLTQGIVVFHTKDKKELHDHSRQLTQDRAVIYTGEHKRGLLGLYVQDVEDNRRS